MVGVGLPILPCTPKSLTMQGVRLGLAALARLQKLQNDRPFLNKQRYDAKDESHSKERPSFVGGFHLLECLWDLG